MPIAIVPERAVIDSHQLTPSGFRLYVYFCLRRNNQSGVCFPTLRRAAADLQMNYSYASTLRRELVKKGWIRVEDERFIRPLRGFEIPNINIEIPNSNIEIPNSNIEIPNSSIEIPNHNIELNREINEEPDNRDDAPRKAQRRGTRLSDEFTVTEAMRSWAVRNHPNVNIENATENFRDYWKAAAGSRAVKMDWVATWRMWIRNDDKKGAGGFQKKAQPYRPSTPEEIDQLWRDYADGKIG